MAVNVSSELLADVKNHLNITWNDTATDSKITNLINMGIAYIDDKCGEPSDYESDGHPRTLLFEYVRYARDGAMDVFEDNYLSLINAMINNRKVDAYAKTSVSCDK